MYTKLTEDVQDTKDELETGGLEYKDKEVEAFWELMEVSSRIMDPFSLCLVVRRSTSWFPKRCLRREILMAAPWSRMRKAFAVMWEYLLLQCCPSQSQSPPLCGPACILSKQSRVMGLRIIPMT